MNYQWKKCSDDSALVIYGPAESNRPTDDYAWILDSGNFIKAYYANMTEAAVGANPCSVEDPDGTPSACGDIDVDWFSDDFSGGSIDCRWQESGDGSAVQADGVLKMYPDYAEGQVKSYWRDLLFEGQSGDWVVQFDWSDFTTTDGDLWVLLGVGGHTSISYHNYGSNPNVGRIEVDGSYTNVGQQLSGSLRVRRVGSTVYYDYDIGSGWVNFTTKTNSNDYTGFGIGTTTVYESTEPHVYIDNFEVNP